MSTGLDIVLARRLAGLAMALILGGITGCSPGLDTTYGRSRIGTINGTGALAGLFRERGHEVRVARRLSTEVGEWAGVIVRFAPVPGPPQKEEAEWYAKWLNERSGRRVVYVPYDYNAEPDYWAGVRDQLPTNASGRLRERVDDQLKEAENWSNHLYVRPKPTASPEEWFAVKPSAKTKGALRKLRVCRTLGGPWARGVDASQARLVRDDVLVAKTETVLLSGDGETLAMSWARPNDSRVLVVASGTFLLNGAIASHPERWALARRVVDWASYDGEEDEGEDGTTVARPVAFVEGMFVTSGRVGPPSIIDILRTLWPFLVVTLQCLALGVAAVFSIAVRMARTDREEPSGADRPVAHPEALGALLKRTTQAREARSILEVYRRWRSAPAARSPRPGARE